MTYKGTFLKAQLHAFNYQAMVMTNSNNWLNVDELNTFSNAVV